MKCPHCLVSYHEDIKAIYLPDDQNGQWTLKVTLCPACNRQTMILHNRKLGTQNRHLTVTESDQMIHPRGINRSPVPIEVPEYIATDFMEACLVLNDSPKASAALSRRCLQNLLLDKAGVTKGDLSKQIQTVIDSNRLPSHLAEDIDAIRNIGNFAAHPNKSTSTGQVLEVEPNEANWNLDVLESMFDFYYVQPAKAKLRREALNAKLADSGKPPMK
jgi:hypothetical protein